MCMYCYILNVNSFIFLLSSVFVFSSFFVLSFPLVNNVPCTEGEVQLLGGFNEYEGVLTVCLNGSMTLVCGELFAYPDSTVACRQAGFDDRGTCK